jgi:hypothetical protein
MPNQNNFRSDITTNQDPRFLASRIVRSADEGILLEQIPASFGFDQFDNVEVHFYSTIDNELVLTQLASVLVEKDIFKSHVVSYPDGTFKHYIRIDITKLFELNAGILIPGEYRMVINFFTDEIGSYENRILTIDQISDSRNEVQLSFNNTRTPADIPANNRLAREFVLKSFAKPDAVGITEKIFVSGVELQDSSEGVTYDTIVAKLTNSDIQTRFQTLGIEVSVKELTEQIVQKLYENIREQIVMNGDARIQEDEYNTFMQEAVIQVVTAQANKFDQRIQVI